MTGNISAIGSYGGLGNFGLGSYYDPSMMSMLGSYSGYGMTNPMMGSMGMMGMYNPAFMAQQTEMMKQMYSAQNEIQKMQLQSQTELHTAKEQAQVENLKAHDRAFFDTVMVNGDFQDYIREIYTGIRDGKMDYVAQKYFELKQAILNKYGEHFNNSVGSLNDKANIDHYISTLYAEYGAGFSGDGIKPDLKEDILKYGENAFQHGFNTAFMGNHGHTKSTAEETMYNIWGIPVEDKGSKKKAHMAGSIAGHVGEAGLSAAVGSVVGATALAAAKMVGNDIGFGKATWTHNFADKCKNLPKWMKTFALIGLAGDLFWQFTR